MTRAYVFTETDDDGDELTAYQLRGPSLYVRATGVVRLTRGSVERLRDALNEWLGDQPSQDGEHEPEPPELPVVDPVRATALDHALSLHGPNADVDRLLSSATLIEGYLRGPQGKPVVVPAEELEAEPEPYTWLCSECTHSHLRGSRVCGEELSELNISRCQCRMTWSS